MIRANDEIPGVEECGGYVSCSGVWSSGGVELDGIASIAGDGEIASGAEGELGVGVFEDGVVAVGDPDCFVWDKSGGGAAVEQDC